MRRTLIVLLIPAIVAGIRVYAHHSFAADYFEEQMVSIEGEVEQFVYRNPHSILLVKAKAEAGQIETFAAEWGGISRLARAGITAETFKPGDYVIVSGSPGRVAAEHKLHLKALHRPADGWKWPQPRDRR